MTLTLVADEFGLLHAAVPHPCKSNQNIQVMVLQAEDGWWCYVDGERVNGTFPSSQQAGQAAASTIDDLRSLATEAATGQDLANERARQSSEAARARRVARRRTIAWPAFRLNGSAIAACVAVMFLAFTGFVVHATGVLETDDVLAEAGTETVAVVVAPKRTTSKPAALPESTTVATPTKIVEVETPNALQPAPGRKTAISTLPQTEHVTEAEPIVEEVAPIAAFDKNYDVNSPRLLSQRSTASLRSDATQEIDEEAAVPVVKARRRTTRRPYRARKPQRTLRRSLRRSRAASSKRRARRRGLRSRAASRSRRARSRPSRRSTRRAIRRVRARKVRRVYKAAFGRTDYQ